MALLVERFGGKFCLVIDSYRNERPSAASFIALVTLYPATEKSGCIATHRRYVNPPAGVRDWEVEFSRWRKFYMKRPRFTDSQILAALKQAEVGTAVPNLFREYGISTATFYNCRSKFTDPLIFCSGVMLLREIAHEYRDGLRDQALDGASEVGSGSGHHSREDHGKRVVPTVRSSAFGDRVLD